MFYNVKFYSFLYSESHNVFDSLDTLDAYVIAFGVVLFILIAYGFYYYDQRKERDKWHESIDFMYKEMMQIQKQNAKMYHDDCQMLVEQQRETMKILENTANAYKEFKVFLNKISSDLTYSNEKTLSSTKQLIEEIKNREE